MSSSLPPSARHGLPGGHEAQQVVLAEAWSGLAKVGPAELKKEAKAKAKKAKNERYIKLLTSDAAPPPNPIPT
jgi:hypothetical protein